MTARIFIIAVAVNLAYELLHSWLYTTCQKASFKKYVYLIAKACIFDGAVIALIYYLSYLIFASQNIFANYSQLAFFSITSLAFAYFWEKYSLERGKWEYAKNMPIVFGVGITPLFQLFLTGLLTLYLCKIY